MAAGNDPTAEGHTAPAINGQTVCTEAERQSRFPAKRHSEPDGLHRRTVTIVPSFQQEIMRMLSNSLLIFMLLSYHTARKNASAGKNSQKNAPGMVCEMPGAYRAAGGKCSLHRMKKSDILNHSISPGRRPVDCPPNCLYSSTGWRKMHPTGADRRDTRRRTALYRQ